MADQHHTGVIEISSEPAAGAEPAHVSVYIDGDRKFIVRTNDLENIGAQLRGKKDFSFFYSVGLPILITFFTVILTTGIAQVFQYVSWRNSTALQTATLRAEHAVSAFQNASLAISKRYYATFLFLAATRDLANRKTDVDSKLYKLDLDLSQQRFDAFYTQLKSWNEQYDQILTTIDYSLDGPVLGRHERVSFVDFENEVKNIKLDCSQMLVTELPRLKLNINSLKIQFAAINYCFSQSIKEFNEAKDKAISDNTNIIPDSVKKTASDLNEDVRSMSNEFRCFAQHRIGFLGQRKQASIFKITTWLYNNSIGVFVTPPDKEAEHLTQTLKDCDFSNPSKG
jgi:hypothetical protein